MLVRNCAGGIIFAGDKVFLLKNEKDEWIFPKGVIRNGELPGEVARKRVKEETGIDAEIVSTAGQTNYEFYSMTRQKPVCNRIIWYIMKSLNEKFKIIKTEKMQDCGYFAVDEAMDLVTYSQDRSLLSLSYGKYREFADSSTLF